MRNLYDICIGISVGLIIGLVVGGIRAAIRRKTYTEEQLQSAKKVINRVAAALKYITFLLLALGLVWCSYFFVMGIVMPKQADYADNMSELIVSLLTVISILFAFVQFLRRKDDNDK